MTDMDLAQDVKLVRTVRNENKFPGIDNTIRTRRKAPLLLGVCKDSISENAGLATGLSSQGRGLSWIS